MNNMGILIYFILINSVIQVSIIGANIVNEQNQKNKEKRQDMKVGQNRGNNTNKKNEQSALSKRIKISKILLEGSMEELSEVTLDDLMVEMNWLRKSEFIPRHVAIHIWNKLKETRAIDSLGMGDLRKIREYIKYIPQQDFFYLNMKNWDLVKYLGKTTKLNKFIMGILTTALIHTYGEALLSNHTYLNNVYGILCGIRRSSIKRMSGAEFVQIKGEVFDYLYGCSMPRLRFILIMAMKPGAYGPPQVWKAENVEKLNMLLLALTAEELMSIRPTAIKTMKPKIITQMEMYLINAFTKLQVFHLSPEAFLAYKKKNFLSNN